MLAVGLGASALAVVVAISLVVLLRTGGQLAAAVSPPSAEMAVNHSPIDPPSAAAASVVPTLNVEDLATADQAQPSAPTAAPKPVAHATATATPPAATTVAPAGPSREHASEDCNPPYTADAKGHIHFKPNCI
jgi:hypothetical protein